MFETIEPDVQEWVRQKTVQNYQEAEKETGEFGAEGEQPDRKGEGWSQIMFNFQYFIHHTYNNII